MTRDERVSILNRILHGTVNSVVQYIDIATPYVPPFCEGRMAELRKMHDEEAHTANEIVALVGGLEGVPQVEIFPYWNVDLNYLDIRFLARFAAEHEAKFVAELEGALPDLRDDPKLHQALGRIPLRRSHRSFFNPYKEVDHKAILLSIMKWDCENYLFEDYQLQSGITIWILNLKRKLSAV